MIVLTNASNGSTVVAAKGDLVRVKLKATDGVRWSEAYVVPGASVSPLVKKSGGVTSTGSSVTTFEVVGYGTAELEATGTPSCTGVVCPTYVLLWQATVDVPVVDPPSGGLTPSAPGRAQLAGAGRPARRGYTSDPWRPPPTAGRSSTCCLERSRRMPPSTPVTAPMGMATCFRPHR